MNQHTKGPWHTRHGQSYTAICAGEKVVGYIDHFNEHDKRLVTSAPDLLKQRDELLAAVQYAADVFAEYVALHKAKGAAGAEKAQSNQRHLQVMLDAIAKDRGQP